MTEVVIYSAGFCPYCTRARRLLDRKGVGYTEIRIDRERHRRQEMESRSGGAYTVPQIFIGDTHVGGYDDMAALEHAGELDSLLQLNRPGA